MLEPVRDRWLAVTDLVIALGLVLFAVDQSISYCLSCPTLRSLAMLSGLRDRGGVAMNAGAGGAGSLLADLFEGVASGGKDGGLAGVVLPAPDGDIDVVGINLERGAPCGRCVRRRSAPCRFRQMGRARDHCAGSSP